MNQIRKIQQLNEAELRDGVLTSASWHQDYKDTSFVYIGNMPEKMNEMDILIAFSQYGVPTDLKVVRDKDTGESKRFAFLKYEDFRSTILAVDNLNGYEVGGKKLRVDHARFHPFQYASSDDANREWDEALKEEMAKDFAEEERLIEGKEEAEKEEEEEDLVDPMAGYIEDQSKHRHHHHHHHHHDHRRHHHKDT